MTRAKNVGRYRATFGVVGIIAAFGGAANVENGGGAGAVAVMLGGFAALASLLPGCGREYVETESAPVARRHHSTNKRKKG